MSTVGVEYHHPTLASLLAEWDELDQLRLREPLKDKTPGATSNRLQGKIEKIEEFFRLAVNPHMRTVCEIRPADGRGLLQSGGRSTLLWLHSNPDIRLLSFDGLSGEDVIPSWQLFVSTKYPGNSILLTQTHTHTHTHTYTHCTYILLTHKRERSLLGEIP